MEKDGTETRRGNNEIAIKKKKRNRGGEREKGKYEEENINILYREKKRIENRNSLVVSARLTFHYLEYLFDLN